MAVSIPIITEFVGDGITKAKKEFAQLETAGQKAGYAIKKAAVPAAAALAGIGAALFDATQAAIEDSAAQTMLAKNIKNATGATDLQVSAVEDAITLFSKQASVADDELRPAFSKLVTVTKDIERSQKLMKIALDASAATGKPLEAVTLALAKAEMGQYAALKKLGIPMSDGIQAAIDLAKEQKKLIKIESDLASVRDQVATGALTGKEATKKLTDATEKYAAQQKLVNDMLATTGDYADDVAKAFGGSAAEAANTAAGRMKGLKIALDETKESIGAALLPAVQAMLPYLQKVADWAQKNPGAFLAIAAAITAVAGAIVAVNIAMAMNPFTAIAAGIALLVVGVVAAYKKFETFRNIVRTVVNGIAGYFEFMINAWIKAVNVVIKGINLIKPGKDIGYLNPITIGRLGDENAFAGLAPSRIDQAMGGITAGVTGSSTSRATTNNVTINVNGGDPNSVVDSLRRYMQLNGSVPIRVSA